eukprot:TRINITY_DN4366_c0_g1_i1.p1 TRINITY_DN4366_c0_g1~~TRINITY_DN4366_c0_g1_i1.p1  ORF type:complete len:148 (+),score=28.97 TRINITY_DN4366_c0_g1_i1:344-787(+)
MIFPKIAQIKYIQMIDAYKSVLNLVEEKYKMNVIESIYYLLSQKQQQQQSETTTSSSSTFNLNLNTQSDLFRNPRLNVQRNNHNTCSHNNTLNNSNLSFISSTSNIQELIANCINYLERQNTHNNNPQIRQLNKQFQELGPNKYYNF